MLLVGIFFGLVTVGFVVPCLIDVAVTPAYDLRRFTKRTWALIIVCFSVFGAVAWVAAGRPDRRLVMFPPHLAGTPSLGQQEALRRHPAGRAMDPGFDSRVGYAGIRGAGEIYRPMGPDDDLEFLEELSRRIRYLRDTDNDA
jgi:Phospholipase_D-nuclease N-terminal